MFTLIHFHKKLNMRPFKYTLLFCLFFLLSFTVIKSADILNVTGQASSVINTGITPTIVGKSKMFCDQNYCYLTISDWTKYHIIKFMRNSTYPLATVVASFSSAQNTIAPVPLTFDVMDYDADKFYIVTRNSGGYLNRSWVYKSNLTMVADTEVTPKIVSMLELSIDSYDFGVVYSNNSLNDNNPREIRELFYTTGYVNSSMMTYYSQPRLLSTVYVPETQEKYLFFSNGTSVYLYIFNNLNLFQTYYTINTHPIVKYSNFVSSNWELTSSIYAYYYNGMVYFAIRQNTPNNNTWYVNVINPTETKNSGSLILLGSGQNLDLSLVDSWVGNNTYFTDNQTTALSFYYDDYPSREKWYVVYERRIASTTYGGLDMMLLTTDNNCLCSDWINASQCGYDGNGFVTPNVLWQTRSCNPTQCDSGGQFADCTQTSPTVNYKHMTPPCSVCRPQSTNAQAYSQGYLIPAIDGSALCSMSFLIPSNALNITSRAIISLSEENTVLGGIPDNSYTAIICNPLISGNCGNETFSCKTDTNISIFKGYDSYTAGNTATASIGVNNVGLCSATWNGLGYGWTRYWVNGQLCIEYDQLCGGWVCTNIGSQAFETQELVDCSHNNTSTKSCGSYGCDTTTGRCKTSTTSAEDLTKCTGDPFTCILTMTGSVFSHTVLMLFAVMLSGGSAIYGTVATKKWQIGIVVGMAVALFFLATGWLDSWIVILWILSVAILFMKAVFFKGD
jgi:hypothetical protein